MNSVPRTLLSSLALFGEIISAVPLTRRQAFRFWFGDSSRFPRRRLLTNTLAELLKSRRIERVVKDGKVKIMISPFGLESLAGMGFNLNKFSRQKWDGEWRLVVFDVWEKFRKQRDFLRSQLRDLGFGMLQESVWISPFPLEKELVELFDSFRIRGEVLVSRSEILVGDSKELAKKVWRLGRLKKRYERLLLAWQHLPRRGQNKSTAFRFQSAFFDLLHEDPCLPRELLPDDWPVGEIQETYRAQVRPLLFS